MGREKLVNEGIEEKIQTAYKSSNTYPELVKNLIGVGILSYTVDVPSSNILYRLSGGETVLHRGKITARNVAQDFNSEMTVAAIRDSQQGKISYPQFMDAIAAAGVRFYEATLHGNKKRVTYIGIGGEYEELISIN